MECPFYIELERRTSAPAVADKLQRYCGHWLRILESHGTCEVRPIIVVHHDTRPARKRREGAGAEALRDNLRKLLHEHSGGHLDALNAKLREGHKSADVGRLIAICSWEEVYGWGVFGPRYHPLGVHDPEDDGVEEGGETVTLHALARERGRLVAAYRKHRASPARTPRGRAP